MICTSCSGNKPRKLTNTKKGPPGDQKDGNDDHGEPKEATKVEAQRVFPRLFLLVEAFQQQVYPERGREVEIDVLEVQQNRVKGSPGVKTVVVDHVGRQEEEALHEAVVLEVDVWR